MSDLQTHEDLETPSHEEIEYNNSDNNFRQSFRNQDKTPEQDADLSRKHRPRILMGRSALLGVKKDVNDSLVVRDLVVDKYKDVMNHYIGRSFVRRTSKERLRTYDDDDSVDSPPRTPSSIGTPSSSCSQESQEEFNPFFPEDNVSCGSAKNVQERFKSLMSATDEGEQKLEDDLNLLMFPNNDDVSSEASVITTDLDEDLEDISFAEDNKYDPEKVLEAALGSKMEDNFMEESSTRPQTNLKEKSKSTISLNTQNASSLLTRINSLCGSLKHSVKKKLHSRKFSLGRSTQSLNSMCSLDLIHENSEASRKEVLESELIKENSIILQVLKALKYCTSVKEFVSGREHLEAEKILLVASCKKEAITAELNQLNFETNEEDITDIRSHGTVDISNLKFSSKTDADIDTDNNKKECVEHFVVIVTCKEKVLASEIAKIDSEGQITVEKHFTFGNLQADFLISVCLYAMKVRSPLKSHSHQSKKDSAISCPSTKFRLTLHKDASRQKVVGDVSTLKPSSFTLRGKYDMRCTDLSRKNFKMHNTPLSSSVKSEFTADVKGDLKFNLTRSGFLNIDIDSGGCWNRRWCVLRNSEFRSWNYPSEERFTPLCTVSLTDCAAQFIDVADRSECARSKTLMLPVSHESVVRKYFLSADSLAEMEQWRGDLNYVLSNLEIWKCAR